MRKVSIIVPIYNAEKVLNRCIDSILKQDYEDMEVILVDDGSKDNSLEIINSYAEKDERVKAIHKENGGVSSTRNLALSVATGDYIRFLDADDWIPFDSTKLMVREMENTGVQMVIGDFYRVVDDTVSRKGSIKDNGVINRYEYADKMLLTPADFYYGVLWNKLYRRDIIEKHHMTMDENITYCEDVIFNLEYLLHIEKIAVLKAPIYYYVKTEGSLVQQNLTIEKTVKMKTNVIKYYSDFYRHILNEDDYEQRKPIIYSYLLAFSTDAFAIPLFSDIRKLGEEEGGKAYYDKRLEDTEIMLWHLSENLFMKLMNTVALQSKLEANDARILYCLYLLKRICSLDEIASLTGLSATVCTISLTKLAAMGHVKITDVNLFGDSKISYVYQHSSMNDLLSKVRDDFLGVYYQGLSEEEIQQYLNIRHKIIENLKRITVKKES